MCRFLFAMALVLVGCWGAPAEGRLTCGPAGECPAGWYCHTGNRCWSTPADGGTGDVGSGDGGPGPDAGPGPACGNGADDDPSLAEVRAVLGGVEAFTLPRREVSRLNVPRRPSTGSPPPVVSIVARREGDALIASLWNEESAGSDVRLDRIDLNDWSASPTRVLWTGGDLGYYTVGLGGGDMVAHGFALRDVQTSSAESGYLFSFDGTLRGSPISASPMPSQTCLRTLAVGGTRALDSATAPIRYVARELLPTGDDRPVVGAIETDTVTYRTSLTDPLVTPDVHVSGTVSDVVLLQSVSDGIVVWDIGETDTWIDGSPRVNDVVAIAFDDAAPVGFAAIERVSADPLDHLLAVPIDDGGVGYTALYTLTCPVGSPCTTSRTAVARVQSPNGRPPTLVRLTRAVDGYVLTVLVADSEGSNEVYLQFLDDSLTPTSTGLAAPVFTPDAAGDFELVSVETSLATSTGQTTVVVAALYRDATTRLEDRIEVAGVRSCAAR